MIDPKELRIGNYLLYQDGYEWEKDSDSFKKSLIRVAVKSVLTKSGTPEQQFINFTYFKGLDGYNVTTGLGNIYPITLTKEILTEWCGFTEDTYGYRPPRCNGPSIPSDISFWHSLVYEEGTGVVIKDFDGGFSGRPAKYLHQLQNLFFALIGTELEIKIP